MKKKDPPGPFASCSSVDQVSYTRSKEYLLASGPPLGLSMSSGTTTKPLISRFVPSGMVVSTALETPMFWANLKSEYTKRRFLFHTALSLLFSSGLVHIKMRWVEIEIFARFCIAHSFDFEDSKGLVMRSS